MQPSKGVGPYFPGRLGPCARVAAAQVLPEVTQESVGHPSGAALHAVLKGIGPCSPGRRGPLRVSKQLSIHGIYHGVGWSSSGAASLAVHKELGHALQDDLGLCAGRRSRSTYGIYPSVSWSAFWISVPCSSQKRWAMLSRATGALCACRRSSSTFGFTQESVGHSGAALHAALRGDGPRSRLKTWRPKFHTRELRDISHVGGSGS